MMTNNIFFFIGTEAELIKVFPIIMECKNRNLKFNIIASGQNNVVHSEILKQIHVSVDLELSKESEIKKSTIGLLRWWINTYKNAISKIRVAFSACNFSEAYMVVHGDTVSTYMGARLGKKLGMTVCHIEAGLRSHNIFNPFPEEIDRILTSYIARMHFAPGNEPTSNLKNAKGKVINTIQNTLLDSLQFSHQIPVSDLVRNILKEEYFVFIMHRQENLANKNLVRSAVNEIENASNRRKCVIILHQITKNAFENMGLLEQLKLNQNVILLPRVNYFDFMKILYYSKFVITDGGSNQEELYYMGKPCLIVRKTTERKEGLNHNAKLYGGDVSEIGRFINSYEKFCKEKVETDELPSKIIVDNLVWYKGDV